MDSNHQYLEDKPRFVQRLGCRRVFDESLATATFFAPWGIIAQTYPGDEARAKKWLLAILEIDGYQLSIPPRKERTFFVLAAKFMILSRSVPGRSTSLLSLDTSGEPGEFSIELLLRVLVSFVLSFPSLAGISDALGSPVDFPPTQPGL
jgi:hypothetical protein